VVQLDPGESRLQPVGYVENAAAGPGEIPYQGLPSVLVLLPEFAGLTRGLEPGYIWVLTWLNRAARRTESSPTRGSFASRTPHRPNPVAITAARLHQIEPCRLLVDALDICSGTPLLDVKPYVREFDTIFGPADPAWRRADLVQDRLARLVRTIERFCGPLTGELALAARLALAVDRDLDRAANSPDLVWDCRCALGVAAGIQAVAGAPLGAARFCLGPDLGELRATDGCREVSYSLRQVTAGTEAILAAAEEELFGRNVLGSEPPRG